MYNNGLSNGLSNVNGCAMGDQCCKKKVNGVTANGACTEDEELLYNKIEYTPYDPSQEPIFPPELRVCVSCHLCRRKMEVLYFHYTSHSRTKVVITLGSPDLCSFWGHL